MQTLETGYISTLAAKLNATDITCTVATAPTVTAGRMHIYKGNTHAWIKYTGVAGSTLTGVSFVSRTADPATAVPGTTFPAGTSIELVEMHDQMLDKQQGGTIAGDITHTGKLTASKSITVPVYDDATARDVGIPTPENGMIIYNTALGIHQQYISGAWASFATGAVVNADTTTAGKVEIATVSEVQGIESVGGTGAPVVLSPVSLVNYYPKGDGSDGNVTISTNTSLTRDMYYRNLTIDSGIVLDPAGYAIYCCGTLTNNGKIARNGNNGGNASPGSGATSIGGVGAVALATGTCGPCLGGSAGGNGTQNMGGAGTNGTSVATSYANVTGVSGGAGGLYINPVGAGGTGGISTQGALYNISYSFYKLLSLLTSPSRGLTSTSVYGGLPSNGGGGGGSANGAGTSGGGGGSGGQGGIIFIYANVIAGSGTIEAKGGTGGNGANGSVASSGGGGSGAGGNGGVIVLNYSSGTPWTTVVTGGAPGSVGSGLSGGANGTAGATGQNGLAIITNV